MSQFPSLPLFTDAWVAATNHLTRLERGTYHDLLVLMWRSPGCRVPNDDAWLGKHLRMTPEEVQVELWPIISEFARIEGNWITQKRLSKEYNFVTRSSYLRSVAAKSMWKKKKEVSQPYAGPHMAGSVPTPTPTPIKNTSSLSTEPREAPPVDSVDKQEVAEQASKRVKLSSPYLDEVEAKKRQNYR